MMKCKDIQKELVNYYYEEIDQIKRSKVYKHLETCKRCAFEWEGLKDILNAAKVKKPDLSDAFWERYRYKVYEKIEGKETAGAFWRKFVPSSAIAAVLLFIILGSIKFYESKQEEAYVYRNYEIIKHIELLEDFDVLQHFEEIEYIGEA